MPFARPCYSLEVAPTHFRSSDQQTRLLDPHGNGRRPLTSDRKCLVSSLSPSGSGAPFPASLPEYQESFRLHASSQPPTNLASTYSLRMYSLRHLAGNRLVVTAPVTD